MRSVIYENWIGLLGEDPSLTPDVQFRVTEELSIGGTIASRTQLVGAHKFVLSMASDVFKAQFCAQILEKQAEIPIIVRSIEAFKEFLKLIYSLFISISNGEACAIKDEYCTEILILCKKYNVEDAVSLVESRITSFKIGETCIKQEFPTVPKEDKKIEGISNVNKFKEEADEKKGVLTEVYCYVCQEYDHTFSEKCVSSATCFGCGVKGHVRRACKNMKYEGKKIKLEEIKSENTEIKSESTEGEEEYVEMEIDEDVPKTEIDEDDESIGVTHSLKKCSVNLVDVVKVVKQGPHNQLMSRSFSPMRSAGVMQNQDGGQIRGSNAQVVRVVPADPEQPTANRVVPLQLRPEGPVRVFGQPGIRMQVHRLRPRVPGGTQWKSQQPYRYPQYQAIVGPPQPGDESQGEIAYNVEHVFTENGKVVRKMPIRLQGQTIWVEIVGQEGMGQGVDTQQGRDGIMLPIPGDCSELTVPRPDGQVNQNHAGKQTGAGAYDAVQRKEIVKEVLVDLIAPSDLARKYKISAHSIRDWVKKTGNTLPKQYKESDWGPRSEFQFKESASHEPANKKTKYTELGVECLGSECTNPPAKECTHQRCQKCCTGPCGCHRK